jgi:alkylation response protein AidB-like acyl-CoA dehydrogenase
MDLLPTSEQQQIIDSAATFITARLPLERLRALQRKPELPSAEMWQDIAALGWFGLGIDSAMGGVGYGPSEEVLLFREIGRAVGAPRLLFTVIAAHVAAAAGNVTLAARLIGGEANVALAVRNPSRGAGEPETGYRLYELAGTQLALAIDGSEARLLDLSGLDIPLLPCMDTSLSMGIADLFDVPVLCRVTDPKIAMRGALLLAAYEVGLAEQALEMIVGYAKIRETFGRPIGAYQAVRHPCADMAARVEEARAQVYLASVAFANAMPDAALQVSAARVLAETAARQNSDDNIQLHGGIGVTDEFAAHFLMKRATVAPQWFGDRRSHLAFILNAPINLETAP